MRPHDAHIIKEIPIEPDLSKALVADINIPDPGNYALIMLNCLLLV